MSTGYKITQTSGNYQVDVDDVLVRREYFSTGSLWYWTGTSSPVTAGGTGLTWKSITSSQWGTFGVKSDGTLWSWASNNQSNTPTQVSFTGYTNNDWKSFSCGYQWPGATTQYWGIKTDGNIWAWGGNSYGQLGVGDSVNKSSPVTVVGGGGWKQVVMGKRGENGGCNMGLKTDGTVWYMNVSPVQVTGGGTWSQIAANESSAGLKTDGTIWTWSGASSPTNISGGNTWKYIACGYRTTWAIRTDGTLWNAGTQVSGGGTNWKSVFACTYAAVVIVGIKTDGTIWSWNQGASPVLVPGGFTNWKTVSTGGYGGPILAMQDITI